MPWPLLFSIPLFLLPVGYFLWLYVLYTRPPVTDRAVMTEYDPPADVAPIEAALLLDGTLKPRALAAAVIGLHMRGAIDIAEDAGKIVAVKRGAGQGPYAPYEQTILAALFAGGPVADAKTASDRMAVVAKTVELEVVAGLRKKGFLAERSLSAIVLFVSAFMSAVMIGLSLIPLLGLTAAVSIWAALTLMAQFAYVAATWRPRLSGRGKDATAKLMGFKTWLTQVEGDYIQWQAKQHDRIDAYTPYAVVFGISLTWATKLQTLTKALLENIL